MRSPPASGVHRPQVALYQGIITSACNNFIFAQRRWWDPKSAPLAATKSWEQPFEARSKATSVGRGQPIETYKSANSAHQWHQHALEPLPSFGYEASTFSISKTQRNSEDEIVWWGASSALWALIQGIFQASPTGKANLLLKISAFRVNSAWFVGEWEGWNVCSVPHRLQPPQHLLTFLCPAFFLLAPEEIQ
jgi:hypothetical protein